MEHEDIDTQFVPISEDSSLFNCSCLCEDSLKVGNPQTLLSLICPVHLELQPQSQMCIKCGQTVCSECLLQMQNSCVNRCDQPSFIKLPPLHRNTMREMKFTCPLDTRGCQTLVDVDNLNVHAKECAFVRVQCKNQDCKLILHRGDAQALQTHANQELIKQLRLEIDSIRQERDQQAEKLAQSEKLCMEQQTKLTEYEKLLKSYMQKEIQNYQANLEKQQKKNQQKE